MTKRITIDPITRIEGHLRIDVEIDDGACPNAWASCTMWRGIENILEGRDPREAWLFTQRFCGVCTTVHAMASVRAVEDALKLEIPPNAQYIRNLILINHATARSHRALLSPVGAGLGGRTAGAEGRSGEDRVARRKPLALDRQLANEMKAAQDKVKGVADSGQLGHFRQRLLGTSGDEAAARGEPARLLALPAGARVSAQGEPGGRHAGRQDAAHPEPRRRRRANAINLDSQATLNMDRL